MEIFEGRLYGLYKETIASLEVYRRAIKTQEEFMESVLLYFNIGKKMGYSDVNLVRAMVEIARDKGILENVKWWLACKDAEKRIGDKGKFSSAIYCPITRSVYKSDRCNDLCCKLWPDICYKVCPCHIGKPVEKVFRDIVTISEMDKIEVISESKEESVPPVPLYRHGDVFLNTENKSLYALLRINNYMALVCLDNPTRNMIRNKAVLDCWDINLSDFVPDVSHWKYVGSLKSHVSWMKRTADRVK